MTHEPCRSSLIVSESHSSTLSTSMFSVSTVPQIRFRKSSDIMMLNTKHLQELHQPGLFKRKVSLNVALLPALSFTPVLTLSPRWTPPSSNRPSCNVNLTYGSCSKKKYATRNYGILSAQIRSNHTVLSNQPAVSGPPLSCKTAQISQRQIALLAQAIALRSRTFNHQLSCDRHVDVEDSAAPGPLILYPLATLAAEVAPFGTFYNSK
jgi:hypothetical protein